MGKKNIANNTAKNMKTKKKLKNKKKYVEADDTVPENSFDSQVQANIQPSDRSAAEKDDISVPKLSNRKRKSNIKINTAIKNMEQPFEDNDSVRDNSSGESSKVQDNITSHTIEPEDLNVPVPKVKESKKQKQNLNDEEAAVKDEDIDKFCEELDDEDNEQYENWVKLIEANFKKPFKNKTC